MCATTSGAHCRVIESNPEEQHHEQRKLLHRRGARLPPDPGQGRMEAGPPQAEQASGPPVRTSSTPRRRRRLRRSEEHTSELQSLMRISYAVFCLKKKKKQDIKHSTKQKRQCNTSLQ